MLHSFRNEIKLSCLAVLSMLLACIWIVLAMYALHAAVPFDAIELPFENKLFVSNMTPENWAFFTQNPRAKRTYAFIGGKDGWKAATIGANGRSQNSYGLDRRRRTQEFELNLLLTEYGNREPYYCKAATLQCLSAYPANVKLYNNFPDPVLCGRVAIVTQSPVPWEWTNTYPPINMPSDIRLMDVQC